ncbi:MAG: RDD family protein [Pikeienuella sp.]
MTYADPLSGPPNPDTDPQFYDGVPAKRLLAFAIDVVAVWGVAIVISVLTLGIGFFLFAPLVFVIDVVYRVITIGNKSATPGMRVMGIELRDARGDRLTIGQAALHTALFYVAMAFVIIQLISVLLMAGSRYGRGVHDMPFSTTMINRPL